MVVLSVTCSIFPNTLLSLPVLSFDLVLLNGSQSPPIPLRQASAIAAIHRSQQRTVDRFRG